MGPSGSGKSSLATAIGCRQQLPVMHLDRLRHWPGRDWLPRPVHEFVALHDAAIAETHWVMDGNYSACLPQRLVRATGLILLDVAMPVSLWRYLWRCRPGSIRLGGLEGGRDSVKWSMLRHIVVTTPRNRDNYRQMYSSLELPKLMLCGRAAIHAFYMSHSLQRS